MFSHILKLIWKKKTSNFLLMLEIFFSFIVLFAVFSFTTYFYQNYRNDLGMQIDHTWVAFLEFNQDSTAQLDVVKQKIKTYPEVEAFSFANNNVPYSFSSSNSVLAYNGNQGLGEVMDVDENYPQTMGITMSEGRWFTPEDTVGTDVEPVVLTRVFKEVLFGKEDMVGKTWTQQLEDDSRPHSYKLVGIIDHFKHKSDFQEPGNAFFSPFRPNPYAVAIMLKVRPGTNADFEAKFTKEMLQLGNGWSVEIQHLTAMKDNRNLLVLVPMLVAFAVCMFLAINVALGLFGVLFQNINRRRGEIGVRRAMGATKKAVQVQFLAETAMLTKFSVLLGVFFAVQFPLLSVFDVPASVYFGGMILAALVIYALALLCAWYPSRQAAQIFPAEALRAD